MKRNSPPIRVRHPQ